MDKTVLIVIIGFIFVFFLLPIIMNTVLDKAVKKAEKGNGSCLGAIFIIVAILTIIMWILQLKDCSNSIHREWEPRHTQLQKPAQNNVKSLTFIDNHLS